MVLSQFNFTSEAVELQSSFSQLLTAIRTQVATVWPPCSKGTATAVNVVSVCSSYHCTGCVLQSIGPQSTTNQIVQAATAAGTQSQQPSLPPPPAIRDNVHWKLNIL